MFGTDRSLYDRLVRESACPRTGAAGAKTLPVRWVSSASPLACRVGPIFLGLSFVHAADRAFSNDPACARPRRSQRRLPRLVGKSPALLKHRSVVHQGVEVHAVGLLTRAASFTCARPVIAARYQFSLGQISDVRGEHLGYQQRVCPHRMRQPQTTPSGKVDRCCEYGLLHILRAWV